MLINVLKALSTVQEPDLGKDLVTLEYGQGYCDKRERSFISQLYLPHRPVR